MYRRFLILANRFLSCSSEHMVCAFSRHTHSTDTKHLRNCPIARPRSPMTRGLATRTHARFGLRMLCVDLPVKARSRTSLSCAESMLMFLHT